MTADRERLVTQYYDALDDHRYETLEDILSPSFVQQRPDRRFESRDAFVQFMREDRPVSDTRHELAVLFGTDETVAARGSVVTDDRTLFEFADFFTIEHGQITHLETFSR